MEKGKLFVGVVLLEIGVMLFLGVRIYLKKQNVLGMRSINPISKDDVVFPSPPPDIKESERDRLQYYYEPVAGKRITKSKEWVPFESVYTINQDALNERFDYDVEKPIDTFRIITLGDSFTYGLHVDTRDNWTERLEDMLRTESVCTRYQTYEVINLGMEGYDIQYARERFFRRGTKYQPDMVLWLIRDLDLLQLNEVVRSKSEAYFEEMKATGEYERRIESGETYPAYNKALKEAQDEIGIENIVEMNTAWLQKFIGEYKGRVVFVGAPDHDRSLSLFEWLSDRHERVSYTIGLPDEEDRPEAFLVGDGHPTVLGHKLIAENIYDYLLDTKQDWCQ